MDRLLLAEPGVPSVSKLVVVFAARWGGLAAAGAQRRPSVGTRESRTVLQRRGAGVGDRGLGEGPRQHLRVDRTRPSPSCPHLGRLGLPHGGVGAWSTFSRS